MLSEEVVPTTPVIEAASAAVGATAAAPLAVDVVIETFYYDDTWPLITYKESKPAFAVALPKSPYAIPSNRFVFYLIIGHCFEATSKLCPMFSFSALNPSWLHGVFNLISVFDNRLVPAFEVVDFFIAFIRTLIFSIVK